MNDPSKINWDRVYDAIQAERIADWDKELVGLAVEKAAKEWTSTVDRSMTIVSTETYLEHPFPMKIDILQSDPATDRMKIVDWKTKKAGTLDERWTLKQKRSWQPKLYAAAVATLYGPEVFPVVSEIRGIVLAEKPTVKTLQMVFTRADAEAAINYLRQVEAERKALLANGTVPWIKDPQGCRAFGDMYKCEFEPVCWPGTSGEPLVQIPVGNMDRAERPFSHSSASEYLRCPERYRLLRVLERSDDEEDTVTGAGNAFHAAMEEIYSQLKLVSGETGAVTGASEKVDPNGRNS
jgi:hypothetical protein